MGSRFWLLFHKASTKAWGLPIEVAMPSWTASSIRPQKRSTGVVKQGNVGCFADSVAAIRARMLSLRDDDLLPLSTAVSTSSA